MIKIIEVYQHISNTSNTNNSNFYIYLYTRYKFLFINVSQFGLSDFNIFNDIFG